MEVRKEFRLQCAGGIRLDGDFARGVVQPILIGRARPGSIGTRTVGGGDEGGRRSDNGYRREIGEIVIRGHNVMKGYWKNTEATEAAMRGGWFHSGDLPARTRTGTTSS